MAAKASTGRTRAGSLSAGPNRRWSPSRGTRPGRLGVAASTSSGTAAPIQKTVSHPTAPASQMPRGSAAMAGTPVTTP